jgi:hypothetical protein
MSPKALQMYGWLLGSCIFTWLEVYFLGQLCFGIFLIALIADN